ncbi:hypothetical protein ASD65_09735 [Microbacterium sp. Root61]|uniref:TetR/AcrR family transcriptional regulator n=1 Tax=Microbacterium sp. Root61 TaxID=1736570 RepID=UPI0006F6C3EC|nr:TetR/AcrR family transcriptional regulator [Microbacterium sp. Root61]KRA24660.1 hypothetical protein ASD65_09735 [Microbacterium sp. Root61]
MAQPTTRVRPREAHAAARRDELIDLLIELFLRDGFAELSLDEMARHAKCSKTTLYAVGASKEQIILAVIRAFFRRATHGIGAALDPEAPAADRIVLYLTLISEALAPASPYFFADLDAYPPAREIYQHNTGVAAAYVQQLVIEAAGARSHVDAVFVGAVAGQVMNAIHRGEIQDTTGLDDSAAYRALASLIAAGVGARDGDEPEDASR